MEQEAGQEAQAPLDFADASPNEALPVLPGMLETVDLEGFVFTGNNWFIVRSWSFLSIGTINEEAAASFDALCLRCNCQLLMLCRGRG